MVAKSAFVAVAIVGAKGAFSQSDLVACQQIVGTEDARASGDKPFFQSFADEDGVQLRPVVLVFVAPSMLLGVGKEVGIGCGNDESRRLVVEVAHQKDLRMLPNETDRVCQAKEHCGGFLAVLLCLLGSAIFAGEVDDEDIQGVARDHFASNVQDVARSFAFSGEGDGVCSLAQEAKLVALIEQGGIDAARVSALRDAIAIVLMAQRRSLQEVSQDRIVLHLAQSHQGGRCPFANGGEHFGCLLKFMVVSPWRPTADTLWEKLVVLLEGVVFCVEKVFHIVEDHAEMPRCVLRISSKTAAQKQGAQKEVLHHLFFGNELVCADRGLNTPHPFDT